MQESIAQQADVRGYLKEPYRLFHLKENRAQRFSYHYHEFDKVVVFLSGQVTYTVEGKAYFLSPGDLLLVPHHHIHQPDIGSSTYERFVLWLDPGFLEEHGVDECFTRAAQEGFLLLRLGERGQNQLLELLRRLEAADTSEEFASDLLSRTLCLQFMIYLNRGQQGNLAPMGGASYRSDPKIEEIMAYINSHLAEDLSVPHLAGQFYLSSSWLMHRFKEITGCTVHQYVLQKRLILAASLLRQGIPAQTAARQSGFADYSTFLRAFRNAYQVSPRAFR